MWVGTKPPEQELPDPPPAANPKAARNKISATPKEMQQPMKKERGLAWFKRKKIQKEMN